MREFSGKAGTIYIEKSKPESEYSEYQVWFEDFCILGTGKSQVDALRDAARYTAEIANLITEAVVLTTADDPQAAAGGSS